MASPGTSETLTLPMGHWTLNQPMTFLPIAQREMRIAARRKSTWRVRWWTALLAMVACGSFLLLASIGVPIRNLGGILFNILTCYCFGLCLLAGVFLTGDSLSEEKRDGTLGLLFLTDLRGYDVVLGKFLARSLTAVYGLLALLPVLAVTLLMGGVTGWEFARVGLALLNALFVSLAVGMVVSVYSREYFQTILRTAAVLVFLTAAPPVIEAFFGWLLGDEWPYWVGGFSPFVSFQRGFENAYVLHPDRYGWGLLTSHLTGWVLLLLASARLPYLWQDRVKAAAGTSGAATAAPQGRTSGTFAQRARWMDQSPVLWLSRRYSRGRSLMWVIAGGVVLVSGGSMMLFGFTGFLLGAGWFSTLGMFAMKVLVAAQACRFFAEARRTGAMELLLSSPLSDRQIMEAQWRGLRQFVLWPVAVLVGSHVLLVVVSLVQQGHAEGVGAFVLGSVMFFLNLAYPLIKLVADLYAVCWVGMALALTVKQPQFAMPLTILIVLVIPSVVFCIPDVLIDVGFIIWAENTLGPGVRSVIRRQFEPKAGRKPPRLPPSTGQGTAPATAGRPVVQARSRRLDNSPRDPDTPAP